MSVFRNRPTDSFPDGIDQMKVPSFEATCS